MKYVLIASLFFVGCAYSIENINTSKSEPGCVRECLTSYSQCMYGNTPIQVDTRKMCKEVYQICINSCQSK